MNKNRFGTLAAIVLLTIIALCATTMPVAAYTYNRQAAANYAYNNAYNDVPGTWRFEVEGKGDCTNFVSHSLQAGGWRETGKYFYWSKYAWYSDWYQTPGYSRSWVSATNLYRFMLYTTRADSVESADQMDIGDVFQIDYGNDGTWDHSMIVTGKDSRGLLMSYHTPNKRNRPLADVIEGAKAQAKAKNIPIRFAGWHIKDNYNQ